MLGFNLFTGTQDKTKGSSSNADELEQGYDLHSDNLFGAQELQWEVENKGNTKKVKEEKPEKKNRVIDPVDEFNLEVAKDIGNGILTFIMDVGQEIQRKKIDDGNNSEDEVLS